ncbi:MAG: IS5 family transposase [Planctomycetota bacterium]|nr:IS5 family transposase [Planctomycetota bacterium]
MGKVRYKVRNWREYNLALKERYRITLWISERDTAVWRAKPTGKRGAPVIYSEVAISCCLMVGVLLRLPLRGCEGFMRSLIPLLGLGDLSVPDYTTLSRRGRRLKVDLPHTPKEKHVHLVVDSSGFKIYGEGEWKVRQHGWCKRRTWRKIHIGIDEATGEVLAMTLTLADASDGETLPQMLRQLDVPVAKVSGDGAYDQKEVYEAILALGAEAIIPPRRGARLWRYRKGNAPPHIRDKHLRRIHKVGRRRWKQESGYFRRSKAEATFSRVKRLLGDRLRSRTFENQLTESRLLLRALNIMTALGMPDSVAIA